MDFLQRIKNLVTGGGFSTDRDRAAAAQRRKEEEERRRREAEAARRAAAAEQARQRIQAQQERQRQQTQTPSPLKLPQSNQNEAPRKPGESTSPKLDIPLNRNQQKPPMTVTPRKSEPRELTRLKNKYVDEERRKIEVQDKKRLEKGSILDKLFYHTTGKQGLDNLADQAARRRALAEYENRGGDITGKGAKEFASRSLQKAQEAGDRNRKTRENTKATVDAIRWLPGAGAGELGANLVRGNLFYSVNPATRRARQDTLLREQMELSQQEIDALPSDERDKMVKMSQAMLFAGVLDFAAPGVGSVAKNVGRSGLRKGGKEAAKQTIRAATVRDLAKQMGTKQGAKMIAADAAIGGTAASAIGGGGALYMGADAETALETAGRSFLPGAIGGMAQSPFNAAANMTMPGRNAGRNSLNSLVADASGNLDAIGKTRVSPAVAEATREAQVATAAREQAEAQLNSLPDSVEVAPGIGSTNAAGARRQEAEAQLAMARQAEAQAQARVEAAMESQRQAEVQAEAQRVAEAESQALAQAQAQRQAELEAELQARQESAPKLEARETDPEIAAQQQARQAEAEQSNKQVTEQIEEPTATATAAAKTDGRVEAEQVATTTPAKAPAATRDADTPSSDKNLSSSEKQLQNVEADIAAIKNQGNPVPDALVQLRKRLRQEVSEEKEFTATTGARVVPEKASTPVKETAPVKSEPEATTTAKDDDGWTSTTTTDKDGVKHTIDSKDYDVYKGGTITKTTDTAHHKGGNSTLTKYTATRDDGTTKTYNRLGNAKNFLEKAPKAPTDSAPFKPSGGKSALPAKADSAPTKTEPAVTDALPTKPKLNKDGTVNKNWVKSEKSKIMKSDMSDNEKAAAVADIDRMATKAADESRKKPQSEFAKKASEKAKETKARAKAEGKTAKTAPRVVEGLASQASRATGESSAAYKKAMQSYREVAHIEPEMAAAREKVAHYDDAELATRAKELDMNDGFRPQFEAGAIMDRLYARSQNKKISKKERELAHDALIETGEKLASVQSAAGQTQRVGQEIISRLPAPFKVRRELDKLTERFKALGKDFTPSKADEADLVSSMEAYDNNVATIVKAQDDIDRLMDSLNSGAVKEADVPKLEAELEANVKTIKDAEKAGREANQAYIDKLESIKPKRTTTEKVQDWIVGSPDVAANYLRMSMLSAPSGRLRDVISTSINVVDSTAVSVIEAAGGAVSNKTLGTNLVDRAGSVYATKEGVKTAAGRVAASYTGKTPPGASVVRSRSELHSSGNVDGISIFGKGRPTKPKGLLRKVARQPRNAIRAAVQVATDASYPVYTNRLYSLGMQEAKKAGLSGKRAELYAKAYMQRPPEKSADDAAELWLESSGMHKNVISTQLSKMADALDKAGLQNKGSKTAQLGKKALAKWVRTSTIPFVQYTGGATHAMLIKQNPAFNALGAAKAYRRGDTQAMARELSRMTWNSGKVMALTGAVYTGALAMSDTGPDGENRYNGPFIVLPNGDHMAVGSLGIAAAAPLIGAFHASEAIRKAQEGDLFGSVVESTWGTFWSTIKASGMDNVLSGENIMSGLFNSVNRTMNNPNKDSVDGFDEIVGGLMGDIGSQAIPAILRDIDSFMDKPLGEAPDTSGKDEDGKSTPWSKAKARLMSAIPGVSDQLPRKEGSEAKTFGDRVFMISPKSDAMKQAEADEAKSVETLTKSLSGVVGDKKYIDMLSEDTKNIIDRAGKLDKDLTSRELAQVRDELADSKVARKFLESNDWDGYAQSTKFALEKLESADGVKDERAIRNTRMEVSRAEIAEKNKVPTDLYQLYSGIGTDKGGGVSQSELKKMLDPEDDTYDPDTAAALLALDELMTEHELSHNGNGVDPHKRPKYNKAALEKSGRGRRGSGSGPRTSTNFGMAKRLAANDPGLKYRRIQRPDSPIPNLAAQTAKTNLKKTITVKKGVQL